MVKVKVMFFKKLKKHFVKIHFSRACQIKEL